MTKQNYRGEHGMRYTRFYKSWCDMKARCNNENNVHYKNYGGRGIKVCKRWQVFINFRDDMLESYTTHLEMFGKKDTTIDRVENNGDYEKENCHWATRKEQNRNSRKNTMLSFNGETLRLGEWAERLGINRTTLSSRLNRYGWSVEKALTTNN